jgi:hypothetical protein
MVTEPEPGPTDSTDLVLRLTLHRAEPLQGSLQSEDGTPACSFNGWMQFMGTLNELRRAHAPAIFDTE